MWAYTDLKQPALRFLRIVETDATWKRSLGHTRLALCSARYRFPTSVRPWIFRSIHLPILLVRGNQHNIGNGKERRGQGERSLRCFIGGWSSRLAWDHASQVPGHRRGTFRIVDLVRLSGHWASFHRSRTVVSSKRIMQEILVDSAVCLSEHMRSRMHRQRDSKPSVLQQSLTLCFMLK